jgi:hypothetical protein
MALIIAVVVHNGECHVGALTGVGENLSSTISSVYYHIPNRSCPASMRVEVITKISSTSYLKMVVIWDVMMYGSCGNRCFRGTYRLHHQGEENQQ